MRTSRPSDDRFTRSRPPPFDSSVDTTEAVFYRLTVPPTADNGLKVPSQVMVDKIVALPRDKCGQPIGSLDKSAMIALSHRLAVMIGISD